LDRGHGKVFQDDVEIYKYLDLRNIIDEKNYKYSSLYKLISISTHSGSSSASGHYTACCLADDGFYYYFSDIFVDKVNEKTLYQNEPYLLFYKRLDLITPHPN
jgi:ubiquitin C-terminal hydrolase